MIDPDSVLVQAKAPLSTNLGSEVMMLHPDTDSYFSTDAVGQLIWNLLEQPTTLTEITATLQKQYEVSADTCQSETMAFVKHLIDEKLVSIVPA